MSEPQYIETECVECGEKFKKHPESVMAFCQMCCFLAQDEEVEEEEDDDLEFDGLPFDAERLAFEK